jgi:choline kinase
MTQPTTTLLILAAGKATRFGGNKQLAQVDSEKRALIDYSVHDAGISGFDRVVVLTSAELEHEINGHIDSMGWSLPTRVVVQPHPEDPTRTKPWGTGHAVLSARHAIEGPFAVCNADDFYGRQAYSLAYKHLIAKPTTKIPDHALISYQLLSTLVSTGGVSRGICEVADAAVQTIAEVREISRLDGTIKGVGTDGSEIMLTGLEQVSMNLWAFLPGIFDRLSVQFDHFRDSLGSDPTQEFYLSEAINSQISTNLATLRCLPSTEPWFGMTFADDLPLVRKRITQLVKSGEYQWA